MSFVFDLRVQFEKSQFLGFKLHTFVSKYNEVKTSVFCLKAGFFPNVGSSVYRAQHTNI